MLIVRVELHSAITGKVTEIARAIIANEGGTPMRGNYWGIVAHGKTDGPMIPAAIYQRRKHETHITNYPRQSKHVWNLVARMLTAMGYK
ncbi:MAG TPA: hypothetical protein VNZ53_27840 [Steroidobacteraceae bacterium]|jgi:hypothetical protein|nr:hypothetical protein [Steroidobacteraceae bacterium]